MDLEVTSSLIIPDGELEEHFVQASGPGGQNVTQVAPAVQLRFDARGSVVLRDDVKERLLALAGSRATRDGVIVLDARRHRTQERNREDARQRLAELIRRALEVPRPRRPTRPSRAAKRKRLESKRKRGEVKRLRGPVGGGD